VGLEIDWIEVEDAFEEFGLTPAAPSQASRTAVPVYCGEKQVGKATTTTWSPILKKMIALGSIETDHAKLGTKLQMELTIEAMRKKVGAKIVKMPFFNPARKTATPV
jgi:aminomethyltransferase